MSNGSPISPTGEDPAIICIYGDSGVGKSVDSIASFATALVITPMKGSWKAVRRYFGIEVKEAVVSSITEAIAAIQWLGSNPKEARTFGAVVFDDMSILGERARVELAPKFRDNIRNLYGELARQLGELREAVIRARMHCVFNAHVNPPWIHQENKKNPDPLEGVKEPGGPKLTSKGQVGYLPAICETVLRVDDTIEGNMGVPAAGIGGDGLWPRRYLVNPYDPQWITKTRYGVGVGTPIPMNLREMLNAARDAGHRIPEVRRPRGLEWIDEVAERVAEVVSSGQAMPNQIPAMLTGAYPGRDPRHLYWAHRDGCARAAFRSLRDPFLSLFASPPSGGPASPLVPLAAPSPGAGAGLPPGTGG